MQVPTTPARAARPAGLAPARFGHWLFVAGLALAALLPRTLGLADFYTIDEAYHWPDRVRRFTAALLTHEWIRTDQTGHPGVTTMWLGSLGRWLSLNLGIPDRGRIGNGAAYLAMLRLPLGVVNGLAVLAGYLLLRRLVRPWVAALAALLWATSPFIVAHSRLLHLDALLTSFTTLSVLCMLVAVVGRPRGGEEEHQRSVSRRSPARAAYLASALCGGLALLTKAPSLLLLPSVGLLLFALSPRPGLWQRLRWSIGWYLPWLAIAVAVVFAGWPAMWASPRAAVADVINEIVSNGGQPTENGNFFMGRAVPVPGLLFYPATVLWRTTPPTLLGLLALLGFGLYRLAARRRALAPTPDAARERRVLLALLGFVLLFSLAMDIEPKQFDRYLLPIWPSLEIMAAAGLVRAASLLGRFIGQAGARLAGGVALALLAALQIGQLWWFHPYYIGYYNPLLGGGAVAQRVMLVGWGEGMEDVGAWLRSRPDLGRGPVLSWMPFTLEPFVPAEIPVHNLEPGADGNYAVLYSRSVQRKESAEAEAYVRQFAPLLTVEKHGITYATVHQLPRPFERPVGAVFGEGIRLRGVSQAFSGGTLTITPSWGIEASQPGGAYTFVHVLAPDGRRVGQLDIPLDQGLFASWQNGQQFDGPIPIGLPSDLPAGEYRVVIGVYRLGEPARLALSGVPALPEAVDGPDAVLASTFTRP